MYEAERQSMVDMQLKRRGITDKYLLTVMAHLPRHKFVPSMSASMAYGDFAVPIGQSQTISQPYIVAKMVELLDLEETDKVLEIGSGSGYTAAVLSSLCRKVIAFERIPELVQKSRKVLEELGIRNVKIAEGDGSAGNLHHYPYDKILVSAACPEIPKELIEQLVDGGIIVAPVGQRLNQRIIKIVKTDDGPVRTEHDTCIFVPLKGKRGFH